MTVADRAPMIGRAAQLADLESAFADVRAGRARVVLVGGEAGAGKTRLVTEFLAGLGTTPVVAGGCVQLGQAAVPFLALAGAMRELAQRYDTAELERLLGGAAAPLRPFVPRLGPAAVGGHSDPLALFGAVPELLDRLAGDGPAVLVLEDLHWADGSTLDLARFLGQIGLAGRLVLMTYRSDEMRARHPLRPVLAELSRVREVSRIEVEPLTDDEVVDLIRSLGAGTGRAVPIQAVVRRAEGNPFFVEELVAAGRDEAGLPGPLRDVLAERLDRLPHEGADVVALVAAVGQRAGDALLRRLADGGAGLDDGLAAAIDAGLLVADGAGYAFRHALLQEAAYSRMLMGRRLALHARIAETLVAEPDLALGGAQTADAEIAFHAERAGDVDTAYVASVRAAEQAARNYAVIEAHLHYQRAVGLVGRVDTAGGSEVVEVLRQAAMAADHADEAVLGVRALELALELLPADDRYRRVEVQTEMARLRYRSGQGTAALADMTAAEAAAGPEPSPARAVLLSAQAWLGLVTGEPADVVDLAETALEMARSQGAEHAEAGALMALGCCRIILDEDHGAGLDMGRQAVALARRLGAIDVLWTTYANIGWALEGANLEDESFAWMAESMADVAADGMSGSGVDFLHVTYADALINRGDWDQADEILRRVRFTRSAGAAQMYRDSTAGLLATLRGRFEEARSLIAAMDASAYIDSDQWRVTAQGLRLRLAVGEGVAADVAALLDPQWTLLDRSDSKFEILVARAAVLLAETDAERWGAELDRLDEHLGRAQSAVLTIGQRERIEAARLLLRAERARLAGRPDPAAWRAFLATSPTAHDYVGGEIYAGWRLAEAMLEGGDDPTEILLGTYVLAHDLGSPYAGDLERLARRARIRLPGAARDDQAHTVDRGLTPRENEVLRVLMTGATNRGIAQQLFISEKTVSVHLTNLMAKLGVSNRTEAAAVGHAMGL